MADNTKTLTQMMSEGYSDGEIVHKILTGSFNKDTKIRALQKIREGIEVAEGTTRKIPVTPAMLFKAIMGEENDLGKITEADVELIANTCSDNRNEVRDRLKSLFSMSLAYSTTDGAGMNSTTNIELFRDRIQKIRVLNAGFTNEQHAQIEDEVVFAVVNNVMSADAAMKVLREVCPEIAEESLRRLQENVTGEFGMGGQSKSIAAAVVGTGSLNANPEQNSQSTNYNTNPFIDAINANVQDTTSSVANSFITDGLSGSNTRANAISNSSSGALPDRRAAFMYQLVGVMSYYDVENFLNKLDRQFHTVNPSAKQDVTNEHEQQILERAHTSFESFDKGNNPDKVHDVVDPVTPNTVAKSKDDEDTVATADETPKPTPEQLRAVIRTIGVFLSTRSDGIQGALTTLYNNPDVDLPNQKPDRKLEPHYAALYNVDEKDVSNGPGNYIDDYRIATECIDELKKSGMNVTQMIAMFKELDKDFEAKVHVVMQREKEELEAQSPVREKLPQKK